MDKTPKSKSQKLMLNRGGTSAASTTPTTPKNLPIGQDLEDSPLYFPSTQESNEAIEVLWDWNSPQQSQKRRKPLKRLLPMPSPRNPIKRHPSNSAPPNFDKLREELRALQEELAIPDDDNYLFVSPQQEDEYKAESRKVLVDNLDDMFNDSIDEQLLLMSQKIENEYNLNHPQGSKTENKCDKNEPAFSDDSLDEAFGTLDEDELISKSSAQLNQQQTQLQISSQVHRDNKTVRNNNVIETASGRMQFNRTKSFEIATQKQGGSLPPSIVAEIERKRLEALAKLNAKKTQSSPVFNSQPRVITSAKTSPEEIQKKRLETQVHRDETIVRNNNVIETASGKMEFHRTRSFEIATQKHGESLPPSIVAEIERKRLEALAKLNAKKKQSSPIVMSQPHVITSAKCSPEEIEKKRLEALARLETKRVNDIIERNRQEALKRLQKSRQKNAVFVKSALSKRL